MHLPTGMIPSRYRFNAKAGDGGVAANHVAESRDRTATASEAPNLNSSTFCSHIPDRGAFLRSADHKAGIRGIFSGLNTVVTRLGAEARSSYISTPRLRFSSISE